MSIGTRCHLNLVSVFGRELRNRDKTSAKIRPAPPHRPVVVRSRPKRPGSGRAGGHARAGGYNERYKAQPTKMRPADFGKPGHATSRVAQPRWCGSGSPKRSIATRLPALN